MNGRAVDLITGRWCPKGASTPLLPQQLTDSHLRNLLAWLDRHAVRLQWQYVMDPVWVGAPDEVDDGVADTLLEDGRTWVRQTRFYRDATRLLQVREERATRLEDIDGSPIPDWMLR